MQESIVFLVLVQCRRKESSRSLSHLLMSFLSLYLLVTTMLENTAAVWVTGRGAGQPFTVHAVINYPTQYGILYPFIATVVFTMHLECISF